MATRRTTSTRRRARAAARSSAEERWLLLLLVVAALAAAVSVIGTWSPRPDAPRDAISLSMAEARRSNAAVPMMRSPPARPYRFRGGVAARAQAVDCLATAALYEAGDDRRGRRAVIQVVLNRVRARGFPKTICGVVYQGFARTTGCQFSFTCDGSFRRRRVRQGWGEARREARRALAGEVFADVGRATHYHTDWMVPYWRDSLTKVAKVGTHLFYRRGWRKAGMERVKGIEPSS